MAFINKDFSLKLRVTSANPKQNSTNRRLMVLALLRVLYRNRGNLSIVFSVQFHGDFGTNVVLPGKPVGEWVYIVSKRRIEGRVT